MVLYLIKLFMSAALIVVISEIAKRSSLIGGIIASLPVVSLLSLIWLYLETKDKQAVSGLASSIFWMVIPSLILFWMLPFLLKKQWDFWTALGTASVCTILGYYATVFVIQKLGIRI